MKENHKKNTFKKPFGTLEGLADYIKDIFNCPVTVEDVNHRILAYSSHGDQTDSVRVSTIIQRRVPEKVINTFWKKGIIPKLKQTDEAVRVSSIEDIGLGNRVAISIRKGNEVLGYIWVMEESVKLSDNQLALLKEAASSAAALIMKIHLQKKKKSEDYQDFFWQLITGHYETHDDIKKRFQQLNITMPDQFTILIFKFDNSITRKIEENITYLVTTSQKITHYFLIVMGNELILLASPDKSKPGEKNLEEFISYFIKEMKNRFSIKGIKAGSGTIYNSFELAENSYQQALKVLQLKEQFPEEMEGIFHYHQLGVFRYLYAILEERRSNPYEHPAITKLEEYDRINKTNLLDTLEVFLNQDSNINKAAKTIFVHANTLNYRMKRIIEIGEIDLKDVNVKLSLYLDLKARRIEKSIL